MPNYIGSSLKNEISIDKLYSVHYFEFHRSYKFIGESHNFWEFVYADKGDVIVSSDSKKFILKQGNIVFHKPNEWHNLCANDNVSPNIAIVSFECTSPAMNFFENKVIAIEQEQKLIISKIISEYTNAFSTPLDNPNTKQLERKPNAVIGSEQLIRHYITELLISFLRQHTPALQPPLLNIGTDNPLFSLLTNYMVEHISETITIHDLTEYSGYNKTTISSTFKKCAHTSVINYFIKLKIDLAKKHLREADYNISQISEMLGYSSIHYFSRQFKKITGMSPSEYSSSIKAMTTSL